MSGGCLAPPPVKKGVKKNFSTSPAGGRGFFFLSFFRLVGFFLPTGSKLFRSQRRFPRAVSPSPTRFIGRDLQILTYSTAGRRCQYTQDLSFSLSPTSFPSLFPTVGSVCVRVFFLQPPDSSGGIYKHGLTALLAAAARIHRILVSLSLPSYPSLFPTVGSVCVRVSFLHIL